MKYSIKHIFYALASTVLVAGCEAEFDNPVGDTSSYSSGTADFSTFVAIGDSLTAGYADGALYRTGQENSYGNILAQQFALVGGGAFAQPLMPVDATGSLTANTVDLGLGDRYFLFPTGDPDDPLTPAPLNKAAPPLVISTEILPPLLTGPFNNMGVPGAKSFHLLADTYGNPAALPNANPYYIRMASSTSGTVLGDAAGQAPTFFVLWIGNNDILSYATGGGVGTDQTGNPDPSTYTSDEDITDPGFFGAVGYPTIVGGMTAAGGKGVLVNIPDISSIPYFTTVPYNAIPLDAPTAAFLNGEFAAYNAGVNSLIGVGLDAAEAAQRQVVFVEGQNPVLILDEDLSDLTVYNAALISMRQATSSDLILLPVLSKLGEEDVIGVPATTWGVSYPLLDADVLTETEVGVVEAARTAYNATIQTTADNSANLLLYDAAARMDELDTDGIFYGTGGITSTYASGGGFSLDGVHPTARGYAVIANDIIDTINTGFSANIPSVDPGAYTTVFIQ